MTNGPAYGPIPPSAGAAALEYGRQRRNWLRCHWKLLLFVIFATAVLILCYTHRATLLARANWVYWSKRAAAHSMPTESVPLLRRISASEALQSDYVLLRQPRASTQPVAAYAPPAYRRLLDMDPRLYQYRPDYGRTDVLPLVYMGTVHRPDGLPRLMIITGSGGFRPLESLRIAVLPVASLFDPPPSAPPSRGRMKIVWTIRCGPPARPLEVHSGVLDPLDTSRVVLHFVVGDDFVGEPLILAERFVGEGDLQVTLQNNDAVQVSVRNSPKGIHAEVYGPN